MSGHGVIIEGDPLATPVPVSVAPGGTQDINLIEYGGVAVGPGNPIDIAGTVAAVQSGAWAVTIPTPVPVTDNGGSLTVDTPQLPAALVGGRLDISIGASPATVPISAVALPLPAGASTEATLATRLAEATFTGRFPAAAVLADNTGNPTLTQIAAYLMALDPAGTWDRMVGNATAGLRTNHDRATLIVPVSPAANAGATITLPAAGAGLFHYITHIYIGRHSTAALAGGGTLTITTTNLNGLTWRVGNQASITVAIMSPQPMIDSDFVHPLRSAVANVATTIVLPAPGAAVLWTAWCAYYTGP